jgi:DNA transposition AAA+ family ATPase
MKNLFVVTPNVERAISLVTSLEKRGEGMPGLAFIAGSPGEGKTRTMIWLADRMRAVFVRCLAVATLRSFLEQLAIELGTEAAFRTADIYKQIRETLLEAPRLLIIDEVDRLCWRGVEILRDLSDETGVPIILVGTTESQRRLARFRHIYYRMKSHILHFNPLSKADVKLFADEVCEVELAEDTIQEIFDRTNGRIGDLIGELYTAEKIAKANDLNLVQRKHITRRAA